MSKCNCPDPLTILTESRSEAPQRSVPDSAGGSPASDVQSITATPGDELTAAHVMRKLNEAGLTVEPRGRRLRISPQEKITPDLLQMAKTRKAEILAVLEERRTTVCCPWCRSPRLLEGRAGRIWCTDCQQVAWWVRGDGEVIRTDCLDQEYIDP